MTEPEVKALRLSLASADAALAAARAAVQAAHAFVARPEPAEEPEVCRFCDMRAVREYENGVRICVDCNRDQREE